MARPTDAMLPDRRTRPSALRPELRPRRVPRANPASLRTSARMLAGPALAEIVEQRVEFGARQGRAFDQPQILVAALAGQQRQLDALRARDRGKPVAAIAPPVVAAEDAHQDDLGVRGDAVDPEVDRHRMAQVAQRGKPHRRQAFGIRLPRGREPGQIAVGEGQRHDIRRRLPRSTGSARSSSEADVVVRMCMAQNLRSAGEDLFDRRPVQALQADHHQPRAAVVLQPSRRGRSSG